MGINFRLGRDPFGSLSAEAVISRIEQLSDDYARNASSTEVLYPTKVRVWAATQSFGGHWNFAPAKVLGYARDVRTFVKLVEKDIPMTGIDAVLALKKRGFIDCDPNEFASVKARFYRWMEDLVGYPPRAKFRFMIHRKDILQMSPALQKVLSVCTQLRPPELYALIDLLTAGEI